MPKVVKLKTADIPSMDLTKGMQPRYLVRHGTVGYRYNLRATDEPAINVCAIGATPTNLEPIVGPGRARQINAAADQAVRA